MTESRYLRLASGLFFLSGMTGLVYEILWTRRLTLVFGHSVVAASTVLAAFMAGLGLGSLAGGHWADRAGRSPAECFRAYARLEVGVGLVALLSLPLLSAVDWAHIQLARAGLSGAALQLACLLLALAVLLPPTMLMGATLPVLMRGVAPFVPPGRALALLYGTNTLGACLGAALAGYLLLPNLGLTLSIVLSACLNGVLARTAWRRAPDLPAGEISVRAQDSESPPRAPGTTMVPWAVALAGASAMALQVGWTRGLVLSLGSSTYAFAAILTLFLAGLGLGSLLYALRPPAAPQPTHLAWVQVAAAAGAAVATVGLGLLPYLMFLLAPHIRTNLAGTLVVQLCMAGLILVPPALLLGLAFPLALDLFKQGGLGHRVAGLYAANTAGCVLGAVLTGFVWLPAWGAQATLQGACLVLLASGLLLALPGKSLPGRLLWMGCLGLSCLAVLATPRWNPALMSAGLSIYSYAATPSLDALSRLPGPAWYEDGMSSTVSVHAKPNGTLTLRVNGKADASTAVADLSTMYLVGYIPALWTRPQRAAVIGLGGGMTLEALAGVPGMERVDCAELERNVIQAQDWWKGFNGRVVDDPRVHVREADGRTFIRSSPERYDIIVSEPSNVWMAGVGNLYTREFYALCRERLTSGGVMAQWFQNYAVGPEDVGMVVRTFFSVFPHGSVWVTSTGERDLVLIGSTAPLQMDLAWVRTLASVPAIRRHLVQLGLLDPEAILGHFVCDRESALKAFAAAGLNTDDRPALEFAAARRLYSAQDQRIHGLCLGLASASRPLPAGIPEEPATLAAAVQGWLSSREVPELQRLLGTFGPYFTSQPLVRALTEPLDPRATPATLEKLYQEALTRPATRSLAAYLLGQQLQGREAWAAAARWYTQALADPAPGIAAQTWLNLGVCRYRLDQTSDAVQAFRRSVECGGGYEARTLLGDAWLKQREPERALECYARAATENPAYVPALWGRGQAWLALERYELASAAFQDVVDLVPDHALALVNLAHCQTQLRDLRAATRTYRRLLHYHPDNAVATHNLWLLEHLGPRLLGPATPLVGK